MRESSADKIPYKDCVIWIRSCEMKSGGWVPEALVVVPEAEGNRQQALQYPAEATLALCEEADAEALAMGKQWAGWPGDQVARSHGF